MHRSAHVIHYPSACLYRPTHPPIHPSTHPPPPTQARTCSRAGRRRWTPAGRRAPAPSCWPPRTSPAPRRAAPPVTRPSRDRNPAAGRKNIYEERAARRQRAGQNIYQERAARRRRAEPPPVHQPPMGTSPRLADVRVQGEEGGEEEEYKSPKIQLYIYI